MKFITPPAPCVLYKEFFSVKGEGRGGQGQQRTLPSAQVSHTGTP